jgi:transglutaminase-like putative cysteine protease/tetratricopeptide (TPR) repeat protein
MDFLRLWTSCLLAVFLFPELPQAQTAVPATASVPAQIKVQPTSPAQTPNGAEPTISGVAADYSKETYVVELLQLRARFEADGRGWRELTIRARVQSESAVRDLGLLVYPYASSFETLEVVYARARKPDGSVVETPASDVQDLDSAVSREAPMYTDGREKHVVVKALSPGDILEAQFRWTVHDAMVPGHFWMDRPYFRSGICLKEVVELDVPAAVPVKLHYTDPKPTTRDEGDRRIYRFETAHLKKDPPDLTPEWEKNFHGREPADLRVTSFTSWEQVGEWYGGLAKPATAETPDIRAKAEELTRGKNTDDEKLRAIYDFVSTRIRYIGVSLGLGRYAPHNAGDVLANRYGDCKDKHTLFAALLQAVNIPAYPALISSQYRLDEQMPSGSSFDHVITAVPRAEGLIFLDTTPELAPYGLLQPSLRDKQALVIPTGGATKSSAKLVLTPADPPFPTYERFRSDATLDKNGTLDGKFSLEERGDAEIALRVAYRNTPQNQWEELTQKLVAGMGFAGTVSNVTVTAPEDTVKPLLITLTYHRTEYPEWKNHRILLLAPPLLLAELGDDDKKSKDQLPVGPLIDATYESTMRLPEEYSFVAPSDVHRRSDFADFSAKYSMQKPGVLSGTLELKTMKHEIPGASRTEFSELATAIGETARRYIFIKGDFAAESTAAPIFLSSGVSSSAIESLEKKVAAEPSNLMWLVLLGRAYVTNDRAKDAVALLEKALQEKPSADSPAFYYELGSAYLAASEREKGFAAYQKALGESPDSARLLFVSRGLAEAGIYLDEAADYVKRAIKGISKESTEISVESTETSDFALMEEIAEMWETLGSILLQRHDAQGALPYLEDAWDLWQSPTIGEHLVEAYELLNQHQKAAWTCNMALAAAPDGKTREKLIKVKERLQPYLKPSANQLSAGKHFNLDGSMALSDVRTIQVPVKMKLKANSSIAHFVVMITNGPLGNSAQFKSGVPELQNLVADLTTIKYPQRFPDDTAVRIVRKGTLSCSIYTKGCVFVLLPIQDAAVPDGN